MRSDIKAMGNNQSGEPYLDVGEKWDWPLQHPEGTVDVINTKDKFEVGIHVHLFSPREVEVII